MSFIVDIDRDHHRVFMNKLDGMEIKTTIIWHEGYRYCLDTTTYGDYCKAKDLQIRMQHQYKDVPIV